MIDPESFTWMFPGERRVAVWSAKRVRKVQHDSRQLVAGGYLVLAGIWASAGGLLICLSFVLTSITRTVSLGHVSSVVGVVLILVSAIRQFQSRNFRRRGDCRLP